LRSTPAKELDCVQLNKELNGCRFFVINLDASTLVNIEKSDVLVQQEINGLVTSETTK
jgi:hypothetical protein